MKFNLWARLTLVGHINQRTKSFRIGQNQIESFQIGFFDETFTNLGALISSYNQTNNHLMYIYLIIFPYNGKKNLIRSKESVI